MAPISYKAKAPGTLMLCGEHAVLQDKRAIVFAVDKWIYITLIPRLDNHVVIHSALGTIVFDLQTMTVQKPFEFVLTAILHFKAYLKSGFELTVTSEFSADVGLGSSAAVTVAMVMALSQLIHDTNTDPLYIFKTAQAIIRSVQGIGSGADAAASVYGGGIVYQQKPPYILKQLPYVLPLVVVYSGSKTPTPEAVQQVQRLQSQFPAVFQALYNTIDGAVFETAVQIEKENWQKVGMLLNIQQGFMQALGVTTPKLNSIINDLNAMSSIYGAKISGSGLGDCVIGIGNKNISNQRFIVPDMPGSQESIYEIPLSVSLMGACCNE